MKKWALYALLWLLLVVCFAFQGYLAYALRGNRPWWLGLIAWEGISWALWGILAPSIFSFVKRFPLVGKRKAHHLALYVLAAVLFSLLHLVLNVILDWLVLRIFAEPYGSFTEALQANFFSRITWRIFLFATIVVASHGWEAHLRYKKEEQRASDLQVQLVQAQLKALKMQVHPHFLFNTLHSLSELIHRDIRAADELVVRLGDFLRMTLQNSGENQVPLSKELEFLQCYLEIEKVRLQERLEVLFDVDSAALNVLVPNLLLQPIVENAIRHGIAPRSAPGKVEIKAVRVDSMLRIEVRDNGPGYPEWKGPESCFQKGLGLSNTRERLEKMYGANQYLRLENAPAGGFVVSMEIPLESGKGAIL
ncbi:histidine kinase [bacterium]|nr:histidine kinase [bacterium]